MKECLKCKAPMGAEDKAYWQCPKCGNKHVFLLQGLVKLPALVQKDRVTPVVKCKKCGAGLTEESKVKWKCSTCGIVITDEVKDFRQEVEEKKGDEEPKQPVESRMIESKTIENKKQEYYIEELKKQRKKKVIPICWGVLWVITSVLYIIMGVSELLNNDGGIGSIIFWGILFVVFISVISDMRKEVKDIDMEIERVKRDVVGYDKEYKIRQEKIRKAQEEYQEREQRKHHQEYESALRSQQSDAPWETKYFTSPCPYCGHYKVRYIKWEDKRNSIYFWGRLSSKIGKNYICDNCKHTWE